MPVDKTTIPPLAELYPELLPMAIYTAIAVALIGVLLVAARWLGARSTNRNKELPYESGVIPTGDARLAYPVPFYLIAIFFIVFDLGRGLGPPGDSRPAPHHLLHCRSAAGAGLALDEGGAGVGGVEGGRKTATDVAWSRLFWSGRYDAVTTPQSIVRKPGYPPGIFLSASLRTEKL